MAEAVDSLNNFLKAFLFDLACQVAFGTLLFLLLNSYLLLLCHLHLFQRFHENEPKTLSLLDSASSAAKVAIFLNVSALVHLDLCYSHFASRVVGRNGLMEQERLI
jgi:hypothetical protein